MKFDSEFDRPWYAASPPGSLPGFDASEARGTSRDSRNGLTASRTQDAPPRLSFSRVARRLLGILSYPIRVLDCLVHVVVYAVSTPIRGLKTRSDELRYALLGPILAILSGPIADPLVRGFFDWAPGRRLYAFGLVSLGAWTLCFVRLFDAKTHAYRYTAMRRYAALWAHGLLWLAGLLFHPLFAEVTHARDFLPFEDARWLVFVAFGAAAVVWHFAAWWPTYVKAEIVDPLPRRPNPYVPPVLLSPHRNWLPNPADAADGIFERGTRLTSIEDLSERSGVHWDRFDIPPREDR